MAALTSEQRAELRRAVVRGESSITFTKPTIDAALQAVEDWFEGERAVVSAAIDAATTPHVFTNGQKKKMVRWFLQQKSKREA